MNESMKGKPMQFVRFPIDKPDEEAFNAGTREIGRLINEGFTVYFQGLTQGVYFGWFVKQERDNE